VDNCYKIIIVYTVYVTIFCLFCLLQYNNIIKDNYTNRLNKLRNKFAFLIRDFKELLELGRMILKRKPMILIQKNSFCFVNYFK